MDFFFLHFYHSVYNSGVALTVLDWTCILMRNGFKSAENMKGENFLKLVRNLSAY